MEKKTILHHIESDGLDYFFVQLSLVIIENNTILGSRTHRCVIYKNIPLDIQINNVNSHIDNLELPTPSFLKDVVDKNSKGVVSYPPISKEDIEKIKVIYER